MMTANHSRRPTLVSPQAEGVRGVTDRALLLAHVSVPTLVSPQAEGVRGIADRVSRLARTPAACG